MFCWGRTLWPRTVFGEDHRRKGDKCNERCSPDRRLTRAPLVALSVSGIFSFSAAPRQPCIPLFLSRISIIRTYMNAGNRREIHAYRRDRTAKLRNRRQRRRCACRQANDFNSVPLSRHEPEGFLSSRLLSPLRFRPYFSAQLDHLSVKLNLLRIGLVGEHGIFKLSMPSRPSRFSHVSPEAVVGCQEYRENWWPSTLGIRNAISSAIYHDKRWTACEKRCLLVIERRKLNP